LIPVNATFPEGFMLSPTGPETSRVNQMIITRMSRNECIDVLSKARMGHLACCRDAQPYVVPIFYAYSEDHAYSFTMPGQKLDWMRLNSRVCLQVDHVTDGGWESVVATGRFEELPDRIGLKQERDHAWQLLSRHVNWWEPGALRPDPAALADHSAHVFYRVLLEEVSGRAARQEV